MFSRVFRAIRLDSTLYEEVEARPDLDRESWILLLIIALLNGLIFAIAGASMGDMGFSIVAILGMILVTFISFLLTVFAIWFVGSKLFGGLGDFGEVRRALAYAYSPALFLAIPCVNFIVILWLMATMFIATRQTLDISNGRTFVVIIVAGLLLFFVQIILSTMGFVGTAMLGGLFQ